MTLLPSRNILVIGPSWVGDMVMAQSLLRLLKSKEPMANIDVLAPAWSHPIVERMPEVREAIAMTIGHGELALAKRRAIASSLVEKQYDQAYVLPNSFKSALIPMFAKIPQRTGWRGEMRYGLLNDRRVLDKQRYPLMVERYLALGFKPGEAFSWRDYRPRLQVKPHEIVACLARYHLSQDQPVLMLCPGAQYGRSKCWPETYFAKVAQQCLADGWQVWLMGGKGEASVVNRINEQTENQCVDLTMTTLAEAIDLMSLANVVVSNDSGMMHIAAGLERPLVAIYGSSSPDFTPPLSEQATVLSLEMACKPCFKRECPLQHHRCMKDITPEMVLTKIKSYENTTH